MRAKGKRGPTLTEAQAARFLHQAGFGATETDLAAVQAAGPAQWLATQRQFERETTHDAIGQSGGREAVPRTFPSGTDTGVFSSHPTNGHGAIYSWFCARSRTQLRAKVAHALAQFLVVGSTDNNANNFWDYGGTRGVNKFHDILHTHALGNYRGLLDAISTSHAMADWLSSFRNAKATATTQPDENYARELMQLFSIGLWQLNEDGTRAQPETPTYSLDDVRGLARVFTGLCSGDGNWGKQWYSADLVEPLTFHPTYHETGVKEFLGVTIPANTSGQASLTIALDTLFNHPSCPPFVVTRLIQNLVTSNPSPAYIQRVVQVFKADRLGVRGNLRAVVEAILLDAEARGADSLASSTHGRFRPTMETLYGVIRTLGIVSPTNNPVDDIVAANGGSARAVAGSIGDNPTYSPSVFNFFSPSYQPPGATLLMPEMQGQTAVTVAGTVNELTRMPLGAWKTAANYPQWYPLVDDTPALVDRLALLLTGGALSATTRTTVINGVSGMATASDDNKRVKIGTTVGLILASADARVQK